MSIFVVLLCWGGSKIQKFRNSILTVVLVVGVVVDEDEVVDVVGVVVEDDV